jgi:hypothetical protein
MVIKSQELSTKVFQHIDGGGKPGHEGIHIYPCRLPFLGCGKDVFVSRSSLY